MTVQQEASAGTETVSQADATETAVQPDAVETQQTATTEQSSEQQQVQPDRGDDALAGLHPDDPEVAGKFGPAQPEGEKPEAKGESVTEEDIAVTLPDDFAVDDEAMAGFKEVVKGTESKPEMAQKLMDIHVAEQRKLVSAIESKIYADAGKQNAEWASQCRNDPDFGGDKYDASCNYVTKAIADYVPAEERKEFVEVFRKLQLQNQPHLRRFLVRVGMANAESGPVNSGGNGTPPPKSLAERMYAHLKK